MALLRRFGFHLHSVLILLLCCVSLAAQPRERILSYDVAIGVMPDSTMQVEETIRVRTAGDRIRHGIYRDFPTDYEDGNGNVRVVGFDVTRVLLNGKPEPFAIVSQANGQRVRIGSSSRNLRPGEYTYVIAYKTDHQLGFFPNYDELYWNATGTQWAFPIDHATVRVSLPDGVPADQIHVEGYTGVQGAKGQAYKANVENGVATFETTERLDPQEGITIVVEWPKGYVAQPGPAPVRRARRNNTIPWSEILDWRHTRLRDAGGIAMAAGALILFIMLLGAWVMVGRDPQGRSITVAYEPPRNLSPAAMRYARMLNVDPKALTAAVLSMASKKYLTIKQEDAPGLFSFSHTYALTRTGKDAEPPLSDEERQVADMLFSDDPKVANARLLLETQMAELQKKHPMLAEMAKGLAQLAGTPDDNNTVRLRPANPRILHAYQAAQKAIKLNLPEKTLMQTHWGLIALAVLYVIGCVLVCINVYPGNLGGNNAPFIPLAVFIMIFNMVSCLSIASNLSVFLPVESFAPHRSIGKKIGGFIGLILFTVFALVTGYVIAKLTSVEWEAAFAFMWLSIGIFQRLLKSPTELGQQYWDEIEGFRQFLSEVDEDRLNRMNPPSKTPALFERMLPYAIALDCEMEWGKKFEQVLAMAATVDSSGHSAYSPSWYSGSQALNAAAFTSSFTSSFGSAIASSATPPGSSSGGGGGGSSGGGGGGGGGGGW